VIIVIYTLCYCIGMTRQLTVKEKLFVKYKLEGDLGTEAAVKAGYSAHSAGTIASDLMARPRIRELLNITLQELGVTFEKAVQPIIEGLQATKQNTFTGEIEVDHATRLKASAMALKLLGKDNRGNPDFGRLDLSEIDEVDMQRTVFRKAVSDSKMIRSNSEDS